MTRAGVAIACGIGSLEDIIHNNNSFRESYRKLSPYFISKILVNMPAGEVSIRHGFKGPNHAVSTACAASAHAVGDAFNFIKLGYADLMLAGGTESAINDLGIAGFARMKALSGCKDPSKASRPFDSKRDGFVIGEGACVLVLETLESALARKASIIAEVSGYGLSGDAFHITSPSENGNGACRAMSIALQSAGIFTNDIDYINAHATSTPAGDKAESDAIEELFFSNLSLDPSFKERGNVRPLYVSSTKGSTGHMLGAAGAAEIAFTSMALNSGVLPPTLNLENPDKETKFVHIPQTAVNVNIKYAISNSFGFGGTNASIVLKKFE